MDKCQSNTIRKMDLLGQDQQRSTRDSPLLEGQEAEIMVEREGNQRDGKKADCFGRLATLRLGEDHQRRGLEH